MNKDDFKVFCDEELAKDCKINIKKIVDADNISTETLLYNGTSYNVAPEEGTVYEFYFSYKDSLVNKLRYENIFYAANDQINHFYMERKEDKIVAKFVGREAFLETGDGASLILIPLEEYFLLHKNNDTKSIEDEKQIFKMLYRN